MDRRRNIFQEKYKFVTLFMWNKYMKLQSKFYLINYIAINFLDGWEVGDIVGWKGKGMGKSLQSSHLSVFIIKRIIWEIYDRCAREETWTESIVIPKNEMIMM